MSDSARARRVIYGTGLRTPLLRYVNNYIIIRVRVDENCRFLMIPSVGLMLYQSVCRMSVSQQETEN